MIQPTITFVRHPRYETNALGETGRPVPQDFEYNSGANPRFLGVAELRELIGGMEA